MAFSIGLDIGGTKIAGALFDEQGNEVLKEQHPTPTDYAEFLSICVKLVETLDAKAGGEKPTVGIGLPGAIDRDKDIIYAPNVSCLHGHTFIKDINDALKRPVAIENDANCAALSEAVDGAGVGHRIVFGAIFGTGIGGGLIIDGAIVEGPNGLTGEWGHVPLPFREPEDGDPVVCACGQTGCIEKMLAGPALSRLHEKMTGQHLDALHISELATKKDPAALKTLDRFYTIAAKALVVLFHTFDPEIVVVSGGLNDVPGMYDEVPKRWGQYAIRKDVKTVFVQSKHGAMSGLRGAAWAGKNPTAKKGSRAQHV